MPMNKTDAARQKLLSGLGLCAKARALVLGTPMVCEALRGKRKPYLVLEATDTSLATHKKITDKCKFYQVRHIRLPIAGQELAAALGKSSLLAVVAVCDEHLCRMVQMALEALDEPTE
jgi:ribosomal protein L7Ae-like RNA K-turn-binding protein